MPTCEQSPQSQMSSLCKPISRSGMYAPAAATNQNQECFAQLATLKYNPEESCLYVHRHQPF